MVELNLYNPRTVI